MQKDGLMSWLLTCIVSVACADTPGYMSEDQCSVSGDQPQSMQTGKTPSSFFELNSCHDKGAILHYFDLLLV